MADKKLYKVEKQEELAKYRDLVLATLDYYPHARASVPQNHSFGTRVKRFVEQFLARMA